ncbi:hypothetical protein C7T35_02240 [Variovorax sp. WS11]|uniref:hypothetical protein n=1 Tax=Variovorax sp. WS11 TaxID=1105204 RepID=UPI000D0C9732|nr:hypothetical protein [Variovorax sp. WS11]NDZ16877.1 hypothetical protein [Variovorax sp. WS11]PSL86288.1 hypothetical protein C7T35_02240 [Variovorax sp. WS11]
MRSLLVLAAASLAPALHAQEYTRYLGGWQGPFLLYVTQQDTGAQGPPAVFNGSLQIANDGSVRGQLPDAACTLSGSSTDFVSAANASLELDMSGCKDARFNGHFAGKLINNPALKYASLRLSSMRSLDAATAQVSAILRR